MASFRLEYSSGTSGDNIHLSRYDDLSDGSRTRPTLRSGGTKPTSPCSIYHKRFIFKQSSGYSETESHSDIGHSYVSEWKKSKQLILWFILIFIPSEFTVFLWWPHVDPVLRFFWIKVYVLSFFIQRSQFDSQPTMLAGFRLQYCNYL